MKNIIKKVSILTLALGTLIGCDGVGNIKDNHKVIPEGDYFVYENVNYTPIKYEEEIKVKKENNAVSPLKNKLRNDFAYGMDISSHMQTDHHNYFQRDGKKRDFYEILKEAGVNFIRLRLWNDPKDENGKSYEGGNNDFATDLSIAKQAKRVGLNIMLDFHYSDSWANSSQQKLPKAWESLDNLEKEVYDYTYNTLMAFKNEGIDIDAVQLGNEINNGLLWPYAKLDKSNYDESMNKVAGILKQGALATKEAYKYCQVVIHNSNIKEKGEYINFYKTLKNKGVDFDIIGASYFPYWHGSLDHLQDVLNSVTIELDKPVIICETNYPRYVGKSAYASKNLYSRDMCLDVGYHPCEESQTSMINNILDTLSQVKNNKGLGLFYLEPDFDALSSIDYVSDEGWDYLFKNDEGEHLHKSRLNPFDSTTLFLNGYALPSLYTYKDILKGQKRTEEVFKKQFKEIHVIIGNPLPTKVFGYSNFGKYQQYEIEFVNTPLLEGTKDAEVIIDKKYNATIEVIYDNNYVSNSSFENGTDDWEANNVELIDGMDRYSRYCIGNADVKTDNFRFSIKQNLNLKKGKYYFSFCIYALTSANDQTYVSASLETPRLTSLIHEPGTSFEGFFNSYYESMNGWQKFGSYVTIEEDTTAIYNVRGCFQKDSWFYIDDVDCALQNS